MSEFRNIHFLSALHPGRPCASCQKNFRSSNDALDVIREYVILSSDGLENAWLFVMLGQDVLGILSKGGYLLARCWDGHATSGNTDKTLVLCMTRNPIGHAFSGVTRFHGQPSVRDNINSRAFDHPDDPETT